MIGELLLQGGVYAAEAVACGALGWQMRSAMGRIFPHVKKPAESLADTMKRGFDAIDAMQRDIRTLYHPAGCACRMCEITADDHTLDTLEPTRKPTRKPTHKQPPPTEKVVERVVERKTPFQQKVEQCFKFADGEQQPIQMSYELEGRMLHVTISPQRPPDAEIYKHGESEPVRKIWYQSSRPTASEDHGAGAL
jgi:hypothetical protein